MQQKHISAGQILLLPQEDILPNPHQPRQRFDCDELEGLADSIRQNGLLQPLNVRPLEDGKYELIAGERRLRAARLVGIAKIPCIIMEVTDEMSALFALIENIQRQDLGFFEEARAIERLLTQFGITREAAAKRLGKAECTISNKLRLLRLPEDVQTMLVKANLTERHARTLLRLDDEKLLRRAVGIIIDKRLTVAESEKLINQMLGRRIICKKKPLKAIKDVRIFVNTLNHAVDTIRRAGIEADSAKSETEEYIEYVVRIPKHPGTVPVLKA